MLKCLLDLSSFCKVNVRLNDKLKLTEDGWKELQEVVETGPCTHTNYKTPREQTNLRSDIRSLATSHAIVRAIFYSTSSKC